MEESGLLNVLLFLSLVNTVLLLGFFSIAKGSISAITKMYKMWNEVKEESKRRLFHPEDNSGDVSK